MKDDPVADQCVRDRAMGADIAISPDPDAGPDRRPGADQRAAADLRPRSDHGSGLDRHAIFEPGLGMNRGAGRDAIGLEQRRRTQGTGEQLARDRYKTAVRLARQ